MFDEVISFVEIFVEVEKDRGYDERRVVKDDRKMFFIYVYRDELLKFVEEN